MGARLRRAKMASAEEPGPAASASASASAPSCPLAASPGSLGRQQILDFIVDSFLRTLETGGYHMFAKCYKRLYKTQPCLTKCIYDQFTSHLQNSIREEIQELKQEGNLEALLESLDKLADDAKDRVTPAWRPSGIPESDVRNVVVPYLLKQREFLRRALKDKVEGNARLAEEVATGRKKIADLQEEIQKSKEAWQAVAADGRQTVRALDELP
ncbi:hypothetical protein JRQ81_009583 [Phrynocephalus forsythii]|uniref:Polyamine-modulated factor 1 n=1 Tax=Phrynocephalus forsythii TaxID=171643 RepID=A0A9Q0XA77_9SAUR|nr:hypothetical protein JRQ81_009583 [Phrynocephalus forsythii]